MRERHNNSKYVNALVLYLQLYFFKLQSYGVYGPLLGLIRDFLSNRLQRVVIKGQASNWAEVLAGVPQGSI